MTDLQWTPSHVDSGGESIYYEVTNPDDALATVVFGHGGAGSHAVWFQQVPAFAQRFRVVTWDTRGFGGSTLRSGALDCDVAAADLGAVLDDIGVDDPVHLVAQSMGGWWISCFALCHPERVRSLTYCNTPGGVFTADLEEHFTRFMIDGPASSRFLGQHFAIGPSVQASDPTRVFLYQQLNSLSPSPKAAGTAVAQRFEPSRLRELAIPTLVVSGSEDPIFPPTLLQGVAEALGARFVSIDNAGHSPYFETPEAFNAVLLDFLSQSP